TLDHNKIRPTKVLSSHLVALNESKKHEIYVNAEYNYSVETTQWHFLDLYYYPELSCGSSELHQALEIFLGANTLLDNETDNEYEYFGNGEVVFDNYKQDLTPDIVIIDYNER
ncbi:11346_t:CDS:2, partial [Dentiscutata heterogama]